MFWPEFGTAIVRSMRAKLRHGWRVLEAAFACGVLAVPRGYAAPPPRSASNRRQSRDCRKKLGARSSSGRRMASTSGQLACTSAHSTGSLSRNTNASVARCSSLASARMFSDFGRQLNLDETTWSRVRCRSTARCSKTASTSTSWFRLHRQNQHSLVVEPDEPILNGESGGRDIDAERAVFAAGCLSTACRRSRR